MKKKLSIIAFIFFFSANINSQENISEPTLIVSEKRIPVLDEEKKAPITYEEKVTEIQSIEKGVPVIFEEKVLFRVYSLIGQITASNRAQAIAKRHKKIQEQKKHSKKKNYESSNLNLRQTLITNQTLFCQIISNLLLMEIDKCN